MDANLHTIEILNMGLGLQCDLNLSRKKITLQKDDIGISVKLPKLNVTNPCEGNKNPGAYRGHLEKSTHSLTCFWRLFLQCWKCAGA